jgi:ABC-type multidrug transport system permease subunit
MTGLDNQLATAETCLLIALMVIGTTISVATLYGFILVLRPLQYALEILLILRLSDHADKLYGTAVLSRQ